jgi:uncharacterized protein
MTPNINNLFLFIKEKKNEEVKDFLLKNGIDIKDEFGRTTLINASFYDNYELMDWLLENGANINEVDNNGYTALHFSAQEAHEKSLSLLIDKNANLDIQDIYGNTPAWVCVMNWKAGKNLNNLKLLFKAKADFTIKNSAGRSTKEMIPEKILEQLEV